MKVEIRQCNHFDGMVLQAMGIRGSICGEISDVRDNNIVIANGFNFPHIDWD